MNAVDAVGAMNEVNPVGAVDAASPVDAANAPDAAACAAGRRLEAGAELTSSHWGVYEVVRDAGRARGGRAVAGDPDPSPIGLAMWDAYRSPLRVRRPAVRAGWLSQARPATRRAARAAGASPSSSRCRGSARSSSSRASCAA